ncbi:MAG: bacillithiol biosynthesis deacetylase BshB1 [Candidatus Omnitrophota bacterium]
MNDQKIDIMAFGAHPDDCEMSMGGTLLKMKSLAYKVGICDLSRGESGTYGSLETRKHELDHAAMVLGLDVRVTLDFPDAYIRNTEENRLRVIEVIRKYRPEIVFSFADRPLRHPDHYWAGRIVQESCYLAGLQKIQTDSPAFRPAVFIGFSEITFEKPDFIVDISEFWEKKQELIRCYASQVYQSGEDESQAKTFIHSKEFWNVMESRATLIGATIGARYGEAFYCDRPPQIVDPIQAFYKKTNLR